MLSPLNLRPLEGPAQGSYYTCITIPFTPLQEVQTSLIIVETKENGTSSALLGEKIALLGKLLIYCKL